MSINSNQFPNGLGATTGDDLVTTKPWTTSADVFYVDSVTGNNSNAGTERLQPFATVVAAVAAAGSNDIIVLLGTHSETLTSPLNLDSAGIAIVGEGKDSLGNPTASLSFNSSSGIGIGIQAFYVELRNILFPTRVQANSTAPRIEIGAVEGNAEGVVIKDCRFECGNNDNHIILKMNNNDNPVIQGCTFVVTATSGTPPSPGFGKATSEDTAGLRLEDCTFDGGTLGFLDGIAVDLDGSPVTFVNIEGTKLVRGADFSIDEESTGRLGFSTVSGSGRVVFT